MDMERMKYVRRGYLRGFTLVEMLVVIVVILLLSAILLKLAALFGEKGKRANAVFELEQIQNALNEYFVEYGSYPPVNTMVYEFEDASSNHQSKAFSSWLAARNDPEVPDQFFPDMIRDTGWPSGGAADWGLGYRYGLVSYLYARRRATQDHWYDEDTDRDKAAKQRWSSFLKEVPLSGGEGVHTSVPSMGMRTIWTNITASLIDPWGGEYQYRCPPPYLRYRLWSKGPDGVSDTSDDVVNQTWNE